MENSLKLRGRATADEKQTLGKKILTAVFVVISVIWMLPIVIVLYNSLKTNGSINTSLFALPNAETYVGFDNYVNGMTFGNYPFYFSAGYSVFITLASTFLILLCTSMAAWYISRVDDPFSKVVYYLCVFSMVVPFQMVMFTLANAARELYLNTPWTIPVVYLGFGAGLAVFMFVGFVKSIPIDIEEAAAIDGCGPLRTFFSVGVERLSAALSGAGRDQVQNHSHPHPVFAGQLRQGGPGGDHGPDHAQPAADSDFLSHLPEAHHQRRGGRRRKGLIRPGRGIRARGEKASRRPARKSQRKSGRAFWKMRL